MELKLFPFVLLEILNLTSFNWPDIVSSIHLQTYKNKVITSSSVSGKNINWSLVPAGLPSCQLVHLADYFDLRGRSPKFVDFKFSTKKTKNLHISLRIEDKMKTLHKRSLRKHIQDYVGPTIEFENLNTEVFLAATK